MEPAPFKIHVAKAKDLPLSWYELVLRPDKFSEHLQALEHNTDTSPSVAHLIVTFLDKAGVLANPTAPTDLMGERLVKCALMMASFLRWDLSQLWKDIPLSVQFFLVSLLRKHYPVPEVGVVSSEGTSAHVIFSEWVLRFVMQECHAPYALPRPSIYTWDTTCAGPDQIKDLVTEKVQESLSFLTDYLAAVGGTPQGPTDAPLHWLVPRVCVDLPVLSGGEVHVEPFEAGGGGGGGVLFFHRLCELEYVVGRFHFVEGDYGLAQVHLQKTQELLGRAEGSCNVDANKLRGFLLACEGVAGGVACGGVAAQEERGKEEESVAALEKYLRVKDYQSVVDVLVADVAATGDTLSSERLSSLRRDVASVVGGAPPHAKRQKLDFQDTTSLALQDKVALCTALKGVMCGVAPHPGLWGVLRSGATEHLQFILELCQGIVKKGIPAEKKLFLQTFIRSICSCACGSVESWQQLLTSTVGPVLTHPQDSTLYQSLLCREAITGEANDGIDNETCSSVEHLERMIAQVTSPHEIMVAVEDLFQATPIAQHRTLAAKWAGSTRGFAPLTSESDDVTVTKYNSLIHRVQSLSMTAQCYSSCLDLYMAAKQLLDSGSWGGGSKFKAQMSDYIEEQLLMTELLLHNKGGGAGGDGNLALEAKAKSYYTNRHHWSALSAYNLHIVGAFLLNMQHLSFLYQHQIHHVSTPYTVAARLAEAVVDVMEAKDLRRPLRGLFEAVLSVFSPLLHSNEGKAEGHERQSKLRANLDLFSKNLSNSTALSLLVAALARIWNLLKKPEDEILTEFNGQWPTAIGNAANIDAGHVFHTMTATLNHALQLYPHSTSWIIIKANVHSAVSEHGAALESYMEAAALASNHFHNDIPDTVWSPVTLRSLVTCCCKLGYFTQAVLLCQMLQPVDYERAFCILRENTSSTVASMFRHFWDMTIIEYLIYIHSKKAESHKQAAAIQVAGQVELNFNNSVEVLNRAAQVRRRKFLRTFYFQITRAV